MGKDEDYFDAQVTELTAELVVAEDRIQTLNNALIEAALQIRYLHDKLGFETGTGNATLARIDSLVAETPGMTNPSETRDSELVAKLRRGVPYWTPPAPFNISGDRPNVSAADTLMREAADTIDRLTSTGGNAHIAGLIELIRSRDGSEFDGEIHLSSEEGLSLIHALANIEAASPREGHVEVPVEPDGQAALWDDVYQLMANPHPMTKPQVREALKDILDAHPKRGATP